MVPGRGRASPSWGRLKSDFVDAYRELTGAEPDYPAVQAAPGRCSATAVSSWRAGRRTGGALAAAAALDTTTLLGGFKIDSRTGAQTKHTTVLLRWRGGRLAASRSHAPVRAADVAAVTERR